MSDLGSLIVALAVFMLVTSIDAMHRKEGAPPAEPTPKDCPFWATEIAIKATRCPNCTSELTG
ncbi:MAG: hypothetical protein PVG53_07570 [Holophagae bacterium]